MQGSSSNTITNNVISGTQPTNASGAGIDLVQGATESSNNVIRGNRIGTDKSGSIAIGNSRRGIMLNGASNNTIGGSGPGQANVISGNTGDGIHLASGQQNTIQGNLIGVAADGTSALGNGGFGIQVNSSSINAVGGSGAGEGNLIGNNNGAGIAMTGGTGNGVLGNRFYANASLGINLGTDSVTANDAGDADVGANNLQNFPVISSATLSGGALHLVGTLDTNTGLANPGFRIEAFLNSACDPSGNGEGEFFVGASSVSVDGSGHAAFTLDLPTSATGTVATATATAAGTGDTSEFSACASVTGGGGGGGGLVVNSTNDVDDGTCDATHCSLREAINAANANSGADTITFAIGSAGSSQTILPTSQLPTITAPVLLDGWSQGGSTYTGPPLIHLDGVNTGYPSSAADGLFITGADSTVRGFRINRFSTNGIHISGAGATGNHIEGNWVDGTGTGIQVSDAANNVIGGTTIAARNVVSGNGGHGIFMHNATSTTVQGNYVGTDVAGTSAIPNGIDGIAVDGGGNNIIGGTGAGAGNLASGNHNQGIAIFGVDFASTTGNVVRGNIVGTNPAGTAAIPNGTGVGDGVRMLNAINTTVVGNLISGNPNGVRINGAVSTGNTVQGNYIGTDVTGATAVPNTVGVLIENNAGANTIGGASAGQGNLISGNTGSGIALNQGTGVVIQGNSIGANATGSALGNGGNGIRLGSQTASEIPTFLPATNTQVGGTAAGASNLIANNGQAGVSVLAGQGNNILGNSISANGALGIDLDADGLTANDPGDPDVGSNGRQNFPVITDARTDGVTGTLNSVAGATFRLEFFSNASCDASGNGEGRTYLGTKNVTTNGTGNASFSLATTIAVGQFATATATDSANNTSEFSACKLVATAVPAGNEQSNTTATDDNADLDVLDLFLDCGPERASSRSRSRSSRALAPTMRRRTGRTTTTPRWPARGASSRPTSTTASVRATPSRPPRHRFRQGRSHPSRRSSARGRGRRSFSTPPSP